MSDSPDIDDALAAARAVRDLAHAPYSGFRVGAALVDSTGAVHVGCNVESASYGLTLCAERNALSTAIAGRAAGAPLPTIRLVALSTAADSPTAPCGACRQWLAELSPDARVVALTDSGVRREWSVRELLPDAFDGSDLR